MLQPGDTLGEYRIEGVLGRGGMATVYLAHQSALERRVAIKVLPAFLAEDADFRARFRQEAIAIARLRHPAILVVFDYGEQDGTPYLVGEYLENGTLADQLGAPLPLQQVLRLLAPIADALDFAHAQGIVHRDIKPANILIAGDGRPVLSDFGLAKMLDGQRRLTQSGMVLGTPHYMAPEIASGETGPSIDRYALVVIAYEMLTGLPPFDASTPHALLMLHVQQPVPPPRVRNPALLRTVEAVLLRGLAKSSNARYPTATAFVTALGEAGHAVADGVVGESDPSIASPHPHASAPPTLKLLVAGGAPQPRASSVWRRVPRPTPLGAGLVALLVAGGGIAAYNAPSSQPPAGAAAGIWTAAGSLDAPVAFAQALRLPDGNALVVGGSGPEANGRLADEYDAARGIWITLPAMPTPRSRFTATALVNGRVLVAGGNTGSTVTAGSQVYDPGHHVWRATGALRFARESHAAVRLRDGTVLVAGGEDPTYIPLRSAELYTPATGAWTATGSTTAIHYGDAAVLLPSGRVLLAGGGTNASEIYDPGTRLWQPVASMHHSRLGHTLTLRSDGSVLAAGGADAGDTIDQASAEIYDPAIDTWTVVESMHVPRTLHTATLLRDGTVLVAGGRGGKQMLASAERFDPATGRWILVASMHRRRAQHVAVALDGRTVLIAGGIAGSDTYLGTAEIYRTQ